MQIDDTVASETGQTSRARQVVAHLMLLFMWTLLGITAVAALVEFAHSFRAGLPALGAFGSIAGLLNFLNQVSGRPVWPTRSTLRTVWRTLTGRPSVPPAT